VSASEGGDGEALDEGGAEAVLTGDGARVGCAPAHEDAIETKRSANAGFDITS
jgi:hypothetical protein